MSNYAYVGLLTTDDEYLIGILCVAKALKRVNSKFPYYVLINDSISIKTEKFLNSQGIYTIRRKSLEIPSIIKEKNKSGEFSHWSFSFDKLSIFELTQFDKIIFLDADAYIRKNIDELFEYKHMSALPNRKFGPNISYPQELCSGLLIVEPKKGILNDFLALLPTIANKKQSIGDQDILQEYYKEWNDDSDLHLDLKYSVFFNYLDYYISKCNYYLNDMYVFQFLLNKKPWTFSPNKTEEYLKYINNRVKVLYDRYGTQDLLDCINCGDYNKDIIIKEYLELAENCKQIMKGNV